MYKFSHIPNESGNTVSMSPLMYLRQQLCTENLFPLGELLAGQLLLGDFLLRGLIILNLGDNILLLSEDNFQVAGGAHVRVDSSVSTVCAATHVWGSVNLEKCQINYPSPRLALMYVLECDQ